MKINIDLEELNQAFEIGHDEAPAQEVFESALLAATKAIAIDRKEEADPHLFTISDDKERVMALLSDFAEEFWRQLSKPLINLITSYKVQEHTTISAEELQVQIRLLILKRQTELLEQRGKISSSSTDIYKNSIELAILSDMSNQIDRLWNDLQKEQLDLQPSLGNDNIRPLDRLFDEAEEGICHNTNTADFTGLV